MDSGLHAVAVEALDAAVAAGADYADVRVVRRETQVIAARDGIIESYEEGEDLGFGVRALVRGSWGFAATSSLVEASARRTGAVAAAIASAGGARAWHAELHPVEPLRIDGEAPCLVDPFAVPHERKIELLDACDRAAREAGASTVLASLDFLREERTFVSSEGADARQRLVDSGAGLCAIAVRDGVVQQRTHPHLFGWSAERGGWERIEGMDLPAAAARIGEEAVRLLDAPASPEGRATVILGGSLAAMLLHETLGHALELDRALGMEAATAGTSFLGPAAHGMEVASEHVTVVADPTAPDAIGSFFFDDDGIPAARRSLVDRGIVVDYLSSRDTAPLAGGVSTGASRAAGWNRLPLVRMTNVDLEPGPWSLDDLVADTERGLLLESTRSWSVDDRRHGFEIAAEVAWEIVGGERRRLLRGPVLRGTTPETWSACDAVCGASERRAYGLNRCFKGQPGQLVRVSHRVPPARFREMRLLRG